MKIIKNYYELLPKTQRHKVVKIRKNKQGKVKSPCTLFLDQASNTGYSLYDSNSRLVLTGQIRRGHTSIQNYKKDLVEYIKQLVDEYKIETIFHEEVYDQANMQTTEVLFYLKHAIQDLGYFSEDINVLGLDHMTWKTSLAKPKKYNSSGDHDTETKKWVESVYPLLKIDNADETDAIGMGIAIMINEKGERNFYNKARYNKKLPIHLVTHHDVFGSPEQVIEDVEEHLEKEEEKETEQEEYIEKYINKLRKPFRTAYEVGGLHELELNRRKGVEEVYRRFLTHKDALVYLRIPKEYYQWGKILLSQGISPAEFETDDNPNGDFCLLACRKKRL